VPETYTIRHNQGMRSAFALLVVAACGARVSSRPDSVECAGGDAHVTAPDGSCLVWFQSPKIWVDAKAACDGAGWHLASLTSAEIDAAAETLCGSSDTFTGGNDRAVEGTFVWDHGEPFVYTNWESGEPSNGAGKYQEDCLVIAASRAAKGWDDRPCDPSEVPSSGNFPYLCQY
jgi:hypothetical protein